MSIVNTSKVSSAEPIKGQGSTLGGFGDRRARLSAKPDAVADIYGPAVNNNILSPLYETGGLLFPYTPNINDSATVQYDYYDPIHTNQPFAAFKSVAAKEITVIGPFTAQNQEEARYCLAAIHFLRTVTKMFFGTNRGTGQPGQRAVDLRGTPPPILLFNAYGTAIYHNVPVIVNTYNVEFPQDIDYVEVDFSRSVGTERRDIDFGFDIFSADRFGTNEIEKSRDISAWVPTKFTISLTMTVQNTPDRLRRSFNLNDFRTGKLVKRGGWV